MCLIKHLAVVLELKLLKNHVCHPSALCSQRRKSGTLKGRVVQSFWTAFAESIDLSLPSREGA